MAAGVPFEIARAPDEQRMLLHGVSWEKYVQLRDLLDGPGLRMTYRKGTLELMSPSGAHEMWKKNIARFIELFAHIRGIDLYGYGQTTFKEQTKARGAEPDECYLVGGKLVDVPEIVLEVVHTAPLLDKLDVYAGLGVGEVWVFRDGAFTIHVLDRATGRYRTVERSARMPGIDLDVVARFAVREDTPVALREYDALLRGG